MTHLAGEGTLTSPRWQNIGWAVEANRYAGRTADVLVTVQLLPPGTRNLKQWNQLDFKLARRFRFGRIELNLSVDVYNLINSSVVTTVLDIHGRCGTY